MPGSTPATSQLDWLISTTAMIMLSWSRATRDLLKSFGWGIRALHQFGCSDDGAISSPPAPYHLPAGGRRIRTCMGLLLSSGGFGLLPVLCSERERPFFVPSPPGIRFAERGRGQGTETVAKLGGLPPSVACVSQRLDA